MVLISKCEFAVVEITNRCNLRCPFCASTSGTARVDEMSLEELSQVFKDLAELGCRELTLLGGELVLRPDWREIAVAVKEAGIELQIITNGILIMPEIRKQFLELNPETIGVSVDGATPESYKAMRGVDGFDRCMRLMKDMLADGFREVHAITTFNAKNLADFERFAEMFADTGLVWQIQLAHRGGERFPEDMLMTREQYREFVGKVLAAHLKYGKRLKMMPMDDFGYFPMSNVFQDFSVCRVWQGCQAGRRVIGIRANGDVLPCLSLGDRYICDNLRRRPLKEIWLDPKSFPGFRDRTELTGKCGKCRFASECRAGCSAMAFSQTGTLTETTFCIRQLEQEKIAEAMFGSGAKNWVMSQSLG